MSSKTLVQVALSLGMSVLPMKTWGATGNDENVGTNTHSSSSSSDGSSIFSRANLKAIMSSAAFENSALGLRGDRLGLELASQWPGAIELSGRIPWLSGRAQGRQVQEIGNPEVEARAKLISLASNTEVWGIGMARPASHRNESTFAAHHDTWGLGAEIRADLGRLQGGVSGQHYIRNGEQEARFDLGDLSRFSLDMQYSVTRKISSRLGLSQYRVRESRLGRWTLTRDGEWRALEPSVGYYLGEGLSVRAGLAVPLGSSLGSDEIEAGVGDVLFASPASVGWNLGVGAVF